ncbi:histidinol-phosphatase HisJ [Peribacillus alkalitolerans]|uniref:histidinol-phosphatase HisJ n=1 Tax=Peribacillus alkalitolerans TaxID=1550385 RepID=UPI0013D1A0BC|nr:histidinol-phosphatase HisJ [Peribacillus alkalitolerans]
MKSDGHIHSPYCPHGSTDSFKKYIEKALELGMEEVSFTEHAPLPEGFIDTTPTRDSSMEMRDLEGYLSNVQALKEEYQNDLTINVGLEVDFIEGYEKQIKQFLNSYGPTLDDSILSVHFLNLQGDYYCLDYSVDLFGDLIKLEGSVDKIYKKYYETVVLGIQSDLGPYKPNRIGHLSLVHKFQKKYPVSKTFDDYVVKILHQIKTNGMALDYNGAGSQKEWCGEPYPSNHYVKMALEMHIPLVFGSDAHQAKDLGQGFSSLMTHRLNKPSETR